MNLRNGSSYVLAGKPAGSAESAAVVEPRRSSAPASFSTPVVTPTPSHSSLIDDFESAVSTPTQPNRAITWPFVKTQGGSGQVGAHKHGKSKQSQTRDANVEILSEAASIKVESEQNDINNVGNAPTRNHQNYCKHISVFALLIFTLFATHMVTFLWGLETAMTHFPSVSTNTTISPQTDPNEHVVPFNSHTEDEEGPQIHPFTILHYPRHYAVAGCADSHCPTSQIRRQCNILKKTWHPDKILNRSFQLVSTNTNRSSSTSTTTAQEKGQIFTFTPDQIHLIFTAVLRSCTVLLDANARARYDNGPGVSWIDPPLQNPFLHDGDGNVGSRGKIFVEKGDPDARADPDVKFLEGLDELWRHTKEGLQARKEREEVERRGLEWGLGM